MIPPKLFYALRCGSLRTFERLQSLRIGRRRPQIFHGAVQALCIDPEEGRKSAPRPP